MSASVITTDVSIFAIITKVVISVPVELAID